MGLPQMEPQSCDPKVGDPEVWGTQSVGPLSCDPEVWDPHLNGAPPAESWGHLKWGFPVWTPPPPQIVGPQSVGPPKCGTPKGSLNGEDLQWNHEATLNVKPP